MKYTDLIEAKFTKPITAFHGTTTTFLKSILKHGMIPNPNKSVYDSDDTARENRPSNKTIGGTYFTTRLGTAASAATSAKNKFNGNPIIIIANIQLKSTYGDEDNYDGQYVIDSILRDKLNISPNSRNFYHLYYDNENKRKEIINTITNTIHNEFSNNNTNKPIPHELITNLLDNYTNRILAHTVKNDSWSDPLAYTTNKPEILPIPQAEENYRQSMDTLTKYYREATVNQYNKEKNNPYSLGVSFRITEPVTYSGNNRITHIIEINDENIKIIYGNPKTLPKEFLGQIKNALGTTTIINKNNEPLELNQDNTQNEIFTTNRK